MGRDQAKVLIAKWRERARVLRKFEESWRAGNLPHTVVVNGAKYAAEAFEKCADDLDLAFGRIS